MWQVFPIHQWISKLRLVLKKVHCWSPGFQLRWTSSAHLITAPSPVMLSLPITRSWPRLIALLVCLYFIINFINCVLTIFTLPTRWSRPSRHCLTWAFASKTNHSKNKVGRESFPRFNAIANTRWSAKAACQPQSESKDKGKCLIQISAKT